MRNTTPPRSATIQATRSITPRSTGRQPHPTLRGRELTTLLHHPNPHSTRSNYFCSGYAIPAGAWYACWTPPLARRASRYSASLSCWAMLQQPQQQPVARSTRQLPWRLCLARRSARCMAVRTPTPPTQLEAQRRRHCYTHGGEISGGSFIGRRRGGGGLRRC